MLAGAVLICSMQAQSYKRKLIEARVQDLGVYNTVRYADWSSGIPG